MGYQLMLRKIRKTKRMTQNELAKAIGSTDRIIGSWERGETDISLEDAFSVCLVLGCTPNDLCGWDGKNTKSEAFLLQTSETVVICQSIYENGRLKTETYGEGNSVDGANGSVAAFRPGLCVRV